MSLRALAALLAATLGAVGCGSSSSTTSPTSTTTTTTSPVTETMNTALVPGGGSFRVFTASQAGPVSVTLTSTTPAGMEVGIGIGVPGSASSGCLTAITTTGRASETAQLTANMDAGVFCAGIYDLGTVASVGQIGFTLRIVHP